MIGVVVRLSGSWLPYLATSLFLALPIFSEVHAAPGVYGDNIRSLDLERSTESRTFRVSSAGGSISLDTLFRQAGDRDKPFRFEIVSTNDPSGVLASSTLASGSLAITPRADRSGKAQIVIKAAFGDAFRVFDNIWRADDPRWETLGQQNEDVAAAGLERALLLTHAAFFDVVSGPNHPTNKTAKVEYDTSTLNEKKLRDVLSKIVVHPDPSKQATTPVVLDIETPHYNNSELGRQRMARVLDIVRQERPGLLLGYYMLLPHRSWWEAVDYRRYLRDFQAGVRSAYVVIEHRRDAEGNPEQSLSKAHQQWVGGNALYRGAITDGSNASVADRVSAVFPSLYTHYRDRNSGYGALIKVTHDFKSNTFQAENCGFQNGSLVRIEHSATKLPPSLRIGEDYFVRDASPDGKSFKLSKSLNGEVLSLQTMLLSPVHMYRANQGRSMCQDQDVVDWVLYAEENIKEARKYGKKVYPYLNPTLLGLGESYVEPALWRQQLETVRHLADGLVIWQPAKDSPEQRASKAWWQETLAFMNTLYPRTMTITIEYTAPVPEKPVPGDSTGDRRLDGSDYEQCRRNPLDRRCDVNGDGVFTSSDELLLLRSMSLLTMRGDFDGDGVLRAVDVSSCGRVVGGSRSQVCDFDSSGDVSSGDITEIARNQGRRLGDLNRSGRVDSSDIVICLQNLGSRGGDKGKNGFARCDIDGDLDVDSLDLSTVLALSVRN